MDQKAALEHGHQEHKPWNSFTHLTTFIGHSGVLDSVLSSEQNRDLCLCGAHILVGEPINTAHNK